MQPNSRALGRSVNLRGASNNNNKDIQYGTGFASISAKIWGRNNRPTARPLGSYGPDEGRFFLRIWSWSDADLCPIFVTIVIESVDSWLSLSIRSPSIFERIFLQECSFATDFLTLELISLAFTRKKRKVTCHKLLRSQFKIWISDWVS